MLPFPAAVFSGRNGSVRTARSSAITRTMQGIPAMRVANRRPRTLLEIVLDFLAALPWMARILTPLSHRERMTLKHAQMLEAEAARLRAEVYGG